MKISPDNLGIVASLLNDPRFQRLMDDVEAARVTALGRVLSCPHDELADARADLKTISNFQTAIESAPEQASEKKRLDVFANTGSPDRVT